MTASPILKVRNLTTRLQLGTRRVAVVDNLSYDLNQGKTLALVGESGCGKTLSALSLMRILPQPPALPSEGEVIYQNRNLLKLSEHEMQKIRGGKIAMIFQDPSSALNPVYSIGNQLVEAAELHLNLFGEAAAARAIQALAEVGIPDPTERFNSYPHQLSGGMRQRVMIAMALMCEPEILIADEPTTALDVTIQAQILDLIRRIQKTRNMAVLLITHDMGIVAEMADEVIIMYAAQAVEYGSCQEIFTHMSHPYTQGLFNSRPALYKAQEHLQAIKGMVPAPEAFPSGCRFHPRCPYVMPRCKQDPIPFFKVGTQEDHQAKCILYNKDK